MKQQKTNTSSPKASTSHHVRTVFASVFGIVAVSLVLASILAVWLNRTLTNTPVFVETVSPVITKPDVQNFAANKATDELLKQAPLNDLAAQLLPASEIASKAPEQLQTALRPILYKNVSSVVSSPQTAVLWHDTLQSSHQELIKQLNDGGDGLRLDLHPVVVGVISQLKTTQLGNISDSIVPSADSGVLIIKSDNLTKAHSYYTSFKRLTVLTVVITALAAALSVALSVHHLKTLRRIAVGTGVIALLLALSLQVPSIVKIGSGDVVQQKAAASVAHTLFHNLQLTCLIMGIVLIGGVIASKLYVKYRPKRRL